MQKILSTIENKKKSKKDIFYSSSAVFWAVFNRSKKIDTSISFLNHFLLKREIKSVSLRISLRDFSGNLLKEKIIEISNPITYTFSISEFLNSDVEQGEYAIYAEFTSDKNLAVPFCATSMFVSSPTTIDHVHSYGRAIEVNEISSPIDFNQSHEAGWTIYPNEKINNFAILHTGRLFSDLNLIISIYKKGKKIFEDKYKELSVNPFSTLKLELNELLKRSKEGLLAKKIILNSEYGDLDAKIKIEGLKGSFPRMLFVATANTKQKNYPSSTDFDFINFTHSNFDFNEAYQPKSIKNYGYLNNPAYPEGISQSGFRYYPCKDLNKILLGKETVNTNPKALASLSSKKISSDQKIPSRIVGSNWAKWAKSPIIGDCSTGTYIIEYTMIDSYWHWGLLNPSPDKLNSIISMLNPFSQEDENHKFELNLYGEKGIIENKSIIFKGKNYSIKFDNKYFNPSNGSIWYSLTGKGVGSFNTFATIYFPNLSDGSVEHSY